MVCWMGQVPSYVWQLLLHDRQTANKQRDDCVDIE